MLGGARQIGLAPLHLSYRYLTRVSRAILPGLQQARDQGLKCDVTKDGGDEAYSVQSISKEYSYEVITWFLQ